MWQFSGLPPLPWTLRISGGRTTAEQLIARFVLRSQVLLLHAYLALMHIITARPVACLLLVGLPVIACDEPFFAILLPSRFAMPCAGT